MPEKNGLITFWYFPDRSVKYTMTPHRNKGTTYSTDLKFSPEVDISDTHPRPQGSRIFYDAREPKTVYGAKIRRPLEHSVQKYTNFVYFEAAAWKSWVDRSQTTRDRVRWEHVFEGSFWKADCMNSESGWKRLSQKKKFIGLGICFECYMVGAKTCDMCKLTRKQNLKYTLTDQRPDWSDFLKHG